MDLPWGFYVERVWHFDPGGKLAIQLKINAGQPRLILCLSKAQRISKSRQLHQKIFSHQVGDFLIEKVWHFDPGDKLAIQLKII